MQGRNLHLSNGSKLTFLSRARLQKRWLFPSRHTHHTPGKWRCIDRRIASQIGKQDGNVLAFPFQNGLYRIDVFRRQRQGWRRCGRWLRSVVIPFGMQIPTAGLAESALRPIVLAAIVAGQFQERTASIAIIRIRVIGAVTPLTFHGIDQDPITFRIVQRSSGRR